METIEDVVAHFGVKGMKWGVRKSGPTGAPSDDAKAAIEAKVKAKAQGSHSLTNKEMQTVVTRMNLEQQYSRLNSKTNPAKKGQKAVLEILAVGATANAIISFTKSPAGKIIKENLKKKSPKLLAITAS